MVSEEILIGRIWFLGAKNHDDLKAVKKRTVNGNEEVYANNYKYSSVRAYLNGKYESGDPQPQVYKDNGFLQTAFTPAAQNKIAVTSVDNSKECIYYAADPIQNINEQKAEAYASGVTQDKIFLISTDDYFEASLFGTITTKFKKLLTDYGMATGVLKVSYENAGQYMSRTPTCSNGIYGD